MFLSAQGSRRSSPWRAWRRHSAVVFAVLDLDSALAADALITGAFTSFLRKTHPAPASPQSLRTPPPRPVSGPYPPGISAAAVRASGEAGTTPPRREPHSLTIFRMAGAVEKTRTSTGFHPQRPQRCASTNSATTAKSTEPFLSRRGPVGGRSAPLAKGFAGRNCHDALFCPRLLCPRLPAIPSHARAADQSGFQPISAILASLGTSVTASLIVTLSPGASVSLGGVTFHV